jgi:hypothetical protein
MLSKVHYLNLTISSHLGYLTIKTKFIQETGDEEKKEVSLALRKLRLKYDAIHKLVLFKEEQLELLKVISIFI